MTDNAGNLSIDFLVGFTIFMVAFIWVATQVPNLFLGISSHKIDFDAVAYRTGVILAEDPGTTISNITTPWEFEKDSGKDNIRRFGLALSKETPNILSETKVKRFFNTTVFSYPDDYRKRAIFGDYPYRFNISLRIVGDPDAYYIGDLLPLNSSYGFIRREVKIKQFSDTTINKTVIKNFNYTTTENVTSHKFSIVINTTRLLTQNVTDAVIKPGDNPYYQLNPGYSIAYRIYPRWEGINITIDDLDSFPGINLTKVTFAQTREGFAGLNPIAGIKDNFTYNDGNLTPVNPPIDLQKNVTFVFEPGFFRGADERGAIYINLTFGIKDTTKMSKFLNNTQTLPFDYNYNPANVTQPALRDAVLEVAVW
jgi:hypothetical protein